MAIYTFELGVDWNAIPQSNPSTNITTYYLPWGFVDESTPSILSTMSPGATTSDILMFNVFDITSPSAAGIQYLYLTVSLIAADTGGSESTEPPFTSTYQGSPNLQSVYFGNTQQAWTSTASLPLTNFSGRYLLSFNVFASLSLDGSNSQVYIVDPEMVVGADGEADGDHPLGIPAPQSSVAAGASPTSSR